jgi:hypothetical protein
MSSEAQYCISWAGGVPNVPGSGSGALFSLPAWLLIITAHLAGWPT